MPFDYDLGVYKGQANAPVGQTFIWNNFEDLPAPRAGLFDVQSSLDGFSSDNGERPLSLSLSLANNMLAPDAATLPPDVPPFATLIVFPRSWTQPSFAGVPPASVPPASFVGPGDKASYTDQMVDEIHMAGVPEPAPLALVLFSIAGCLCPRWQGQAGGFPAGA